MAANNLGIGNFDPSKIETWPVLVRVVFGTFIMALIIAGSYFLVNQDQEDELDAKENTETSLRQQFDEKAKMAVNLEQYKDQIIELESLLDAQLRQLPNSNEVANLLDDISFIAQDNGLNLISIKWEPEVVQDIYTELPMSIFVTGTYQQLGSFSADVAALPRIVTIDKFDLKHVELKDKAAKATQERPKDSGTGNVTTVSTSEAQPTVSDGELLEMNMLAKTFRYNNTATTKNKSGRASKRGK